MAELEYVYDLLSFGASTGTTLVLRGLGGQISSAVESLP